MAELIDIADIDIVFISYDEPNADRNWIELKKIAPWAKRIHGVKGSDSAHKAAADISDTDRLVTVDGDNQNRIARLNTDGTLDNTFSIVQGFNGNALVSKVLADNCILVGGNFTSYNTSGNSRLLKLNSLQTISCVVP